MFISLSFTYLSFTHTYVCVYAYICAATQIYAYIHNLFNFYTCIY